MRRVGRLGKKSDGSLLRLRRMLCVSLDGPLVVFCRRSSSNGSSSEKSITIITLILLQLCTPQPYFFTPQPAQPPPHSPAWPYSFKFVSEVSRSVGHFVVAQLRLQSVNPAVHFCGLAMVQAEQLHEVKLLLAAHHHQIVAGVFVQQFVVSARLVDSALPGRVRPCIGDYFVFASHDASQLVY
jgi:hypothetical protein